MNPIRKTNGLACVLAAILLGSATLVGAAGNEPIIHTTNNVAYVSGGVGSESRDRLSVLSSEFNLKLVLAMNSGEYVSGVRIVIADDQGHTVVDAVSDGPWLMARVPAGNYQIAASLGEKTERRQIAVGANKLTTMDFRWTAN